MNVYMPTHGYGLRCHAVARWRCRGFKLHIWGSVSRGFIPQTLCEELPPRGQGQRSSRRSAGCAVEGVVVLMDGTRGRRCFAPHQQLSTHFG